MQKEVVEFEYVLYRRVAQSIEVYEKQEREESENFKYEMRFDGNEEQLHEFGSSDVINHESINRRIITFLFQSKIMEQRINISVHNDYRQAIKLMNILRAH